VGSSTCAYVCVPGRVTSFDVARPRHGVTRSRHGLILSKAEFCSCVQNLRKQTKPHLMRSLQPVADTHAFMLLIVKTFRTYLSVRELPAERRDEQLVLVRVRGQHDILDTPELLQQLHTLPADDGAFIQ